MRAFKAAVRAFASASLGLLSIATARAEDIVVTHYGSLLYGVPYAIAMEKGYFKKSTVPVKDAEGKVVLAATAASSAKTTARLS